MHTEWVQCKTKITPATCMLSRNGNLKPRAKISWSLLIQVKNEDSYKQTKPQGEKDCNHGEYGARSGQTAKNVEGKNQRWKVLGLLTIRFVTKDEEKPRWENRPLALRGHVTSASFKQWVGIFLMPKIDEAHKNYLTLEIWEETHLREVFYGTLILQRSSMICVGHHVGGHTLTFQHGGQNLLFACILLNVR